MSDKLSRPLEVLVKPEVAAGRLAEGERVDALLREPLLTDILSSSSGMLEMVQPIKEYAAELVRKQEEATGDSHVAFNSVVIIRTTDDRLMEALNSMPLQSANSSGIQRQVVSLGSGLETRAWRLPLPERTAYFEIDDPDMIAVKQERLAASGAHTLPGPVQGFIKHPLRAASWAGVPSDLAGPDWHNELLEHGFDRGLPTVFVAEGLLYYLSPEVNAALLHTLSELAAPGSVLLFTCLNEAFLKGSRETQKRNAPINKRYSSFFKFGIPDDVAGYLNPLGWTLSDDHLITVEDAHKALNVGLASPPQLKEEQQRNEAQFGKIRNYLVRAVPIQAAA